MKKSVVFKESGLNKIKSNQISRAINSVKSKTGKIGTTGTLHSGLLYTIVKNGFIIF